LKSGPLAVQLHGKTSSHSGWSQFVYVWQRGSRKTERSG